MRVRVRVRVRVHLLLLRRRSSPLRSRPDGRTDGWARDRRPISTGSPRDVGEACESRGTDRTQLETGRGCRGCCSPGLHAGTTTGHSHMLEGCYHRARR